MSMKLDLLTAPHEFNNLSNDAQHSEAQQRLHNVSATPVISWPILPH